ncbi:hypothetical protein QDY65_00190 [Pyrococcus kukulkanii]|uniref:hypothetical protein n=1 Tax=Pyrococcus kukulkanii TaxID=1609559 RepID=UPI0035612DC5
MKRGFIFTLDAILSLLLATVMITGIMALIETSSDIYVSHLQGENKVIAQSLLETLKTVSLSDLVPPDVISEWIENGTLDQNFVTPQMPPLQIAATYWAINSTYPNANPSYQERAEVILGYILRRLAKGYKYQLIIGNYTSPYLTFDNSYENASDVGSATIIVSGYISNETPRGYVAKAYLTKLVTSQEKLIGIQRVLAGGYYCSEPVPESYDEYPFTVSSLYLEYQTEDKNTVQSGSFRLNGEYNDENVNIDYNLSGWSVKYGNVILLYDNYNYEIVGRIVITDGVNTINLYLNRELSRSTTNYNVRIIIYEDANGNQAIVYLDSGIYVEVTWTWGGVWTGWYISSSRAYTTLPQISDSSYRIPIPPYECYDNAPNSLNISIKFKLPLDATDISGLLNYATRSGERVNFVLNGKQLTTLDISDNLVPGDNVLEAEFINPLRDVEEIEEIGFGSGSWISLRYKTSIPQVDDPGLVRLYTVTSEGTGIYYLNSLFVPGNITGINIKITVEGVHEVRIYYSNGTTLNLIYENTSVPSGLTTVFIDNKTIMGNLTEYISLRDLSKRNFNLIIMLDAYYNSSFERPIRYAGQDYHYEWNNERVLYGYPYSYINITYIPRVTRTRFMIPMEEIYTLDGENKVYDSLYRTMTFTYYLPDKAIPWYVDVWTAINFVIRSGNYPSGTITLYEGPNANTKVFEFPLDYYLIRVAYTKLNTNIMVNGSTNTFKIESSTSDYRFRVDDSRAIVHYFLNGYAPYGKVFPYYAQNNTCGYNLTYYYDLGNGPQEDTVIIGNCKPTETPLQISAADLKPSEYALDDAIYRLFIQLGADQDSPSLPGTRDNPIRIKLEGLAGKAIGMRSVPTTSKAIQVTLRIWRGQ